MQVFETSDADGQTVRLMPGEPFMTYADGEAIQHPANALAAYGPDDFDRFGITRTQEPDPAPPRRQLPKSVVTARVEAIGKSADVFAYLQAHPGLFGRWVAADRPEVYADDAGLLQVLQAASCTPDEIATITAA